MNFRHPARAQPAPATRARLLALVLLLTGAGSRPAIAQESGGGAPLILNVEGRAATPLNGAWHTIVDPFENGYYNYRWQPYPDGYFRDQKPQRPSDLVEYDFDRSPTLLVPGDWNSQRRELLFYEGTVWYRRTFEYSLRPGHRLFVYFGAANYQARVWL